MNRPSPTPHRKRKRAPSSTIINPLSHPPDTLKQFALAGHPIDAPLPAKLYPGFPHRPARPPRHRTTATTTSDRKKEAAGTASDAEAEADVDTATEAEATDWKTTDAETTDTDAPNSVSRRRSAGKRAEGAGVTDRRAHAYQARVGWLVAVVRRCLAEGDVKTASRAFGLLVRARVYGRKVDLRWERFWELGGECLSRETGDEKGKEERLKAYYEFLIQQYPFAKQHAASSGESALDFWVALGSAEMEAVHSEQRRGLERLRLGEEHGGEGEEDVMDVDEPMDYGGVDGGLGEQHGDDGLLPEEEEHLRGLSRREVRLRGQENELRLVALRRMTDLAQRMDTAMETIPFSRDHEMLRLRAMVALYLGDLAVPPAPRSRAEERDSKRTKAGQRVKAREFLRRIEEGGGELKPHDAQLLESLASDDDEDDDEEEEPVLPMFSSMGF